MAALVLRRDEPLEMVQAQSEMPLMVLLLLLLLLLMSVKYRSACVAA